MLYSHKWLNSYFDTDIPEPNEVARLLNVHALEVEGIEQKRDDHAIDVDVLPDVAHFALSHMGVARDLGAIINVPLKKHEERPIAVIELEPLSIDITSKTGRRYIGRRIENIKNAPSPEWLKNYLETIGERSINAVVDATNFIMLDVNQPLHAFDADKVVGGIQVRYATEGEKIILLDGVEVELTETDTVIADDEGPLAVAGVKGGKRAEVTESTTRIIAESANFDPVAVRKTSRRIKVINNSSKRFENGVPQSTAELGMDRLTDLLFDIFGNDIQIGEKVDVYPVQQEEVSFEINLSEIASVLGLDIPKDDTVRILNALEVGIEDKGEILSLAIPSYRTDLHTTNDIAEEVGRLYGYDHIEGIKPEIGDAPTPGEFEGIMALKQLLVSEGFSEVFTSSFRKKGDVKVIRPVAKDKAYMRTDLSQNMAEVLEKGVYYSDLIGVDRVKVFEIGKTFKDGNEELHLCIGVSGKKADGVCDEIIGKINEVFGISLERETKQGIVEVSLEGITLSADSFVAPQELIDVQFKTLSPYPFIARDIALFVSEGVTAEEIEKMIAEEAGELLVNHRLFDAFQKDGRQSYAFRLVFQSFEKTLTDAEVDPIMKNVTARLEGAGDEFEVR